MEARRKYVKRVRKPVVAVQLALDTEGFTYQKWGATQRCKANDWIVSNDGDVYTVDQESFARTYQPAGGGEYFKTAPVWAVRVTDPGAIETKEGVTHYDAGDYLVFNQEDGGDGYAVTASKFEEMYEEA